ncbi:MAG: hypothetical protein DMG53_20325 [Acidobacteria bacterium]|nr:MAG: hypothetical protein DMG53_20325 [Acidobacteriota bacterium]
MVDRLKGLPLGPGKKMASGGRFSKWAAYFRKRFTRGKAYHLGAKRRPRHPLQPRGGSQQPDHFLFGENVRLDALMRFGKPGWVGNEAVGIGPTAIEAEVINLEHSLTSTAGSEMSLSLTPSLKRRST